MNQQTIQRTRAVTTRREAGAGSAMPPWRFTFPALFVFVGFFLLPNVLNFVLPFTDWSGFRSGIQFTGLKTFRSLADDGTLFTSLKITVTYAVLAAGFTNVFGLGLAILLERDTRLNRTVRALFFIPVLISALAVGYVFQALLKPDGAFNGMLGAIAGRDVRMPWLGSTDWTLPVLTLVHAWKWVGLSMLIYLAGLKSQPQDILEAAACDGSSRWQTFRNIRWPLLAPAITFNVAASLVGCLNAFDIVIATTDGGPARTTEVLQTYIFKTFGQGLFAQASAMSLVLFLVAAIIALPLVGYLRHRERVL